MNEKEFDMSVTFNDSEQFSPDETVSGIITIVPHADQQINRVEVCFILDWKVPYVQNSYKHANLPITEPSKWKKGITIAYPFQFKMQELPEMCFPEESFRAFTLSHTGRIIEFAWKVQCAVYFEDEPSEAIYKTQDFRVVPAQNPSIIIDKSIRYSSGSKGIRPISKHRTPKPPEPGCLMSLASFWVQILTGKPLPRREPPRVPLSTPTFEPHGITLSPPLNSDDNALHLLIQSNILKPIYVNSVEIRFSAYETCRIRYVTEKTDFSESIYAHSKTIAIRRAFQPGEQLKIATTIPVDLVDLPSTFELSVGDADNEAALGWYVSITLDHPNATTRSGQRFIAKHTNLQIQLPE